MVRLRYGISTDLRATLLDYYNIVSMALQNSSVDLNNAVALLESLCKYVATLREQFDIFEKNGKTLNGCSEYTRKTQSETSAQYQTETFRRRICRRSRTGVFLAIIDSMTGAFKKRLDPSTMPYHIRLVRNLFVFLHEIFDLTPESIRESSNRLVEAYSEDLEHDLADELVQFCSFAHSSSSLTQGDETVSFELRLYRIASAPGVRETCQNINIALRIYLSLLATNCLERGLRRSFSVLLRVKNNLRTMMTDQRLSRLSLMAIENNVVRNLDFNNVYDILAKSKARKKLFSKIISNVLLH